MPTTEPNLTIDALRRLARSRRDRFLAEESSRSLREGLVATLAYAIAVAVVAGTMLPTLHSHTVVALLPKPPPVVARTPHIAPTAARAAL